MSSLSPTSWPAAWAATAPALAPQSGALQATRWFDDAASARAEVLHAPPASGVSAADAAGLADELSARFCDCLLDRAPT